MKLFNDISYNNTEQQRSKPDTYFYDLLKKGERRTPTLPIDIPKLKKVPVQEPSHYIGNPQNDSYFRMDYSFFPKPLKKIEKKEIEARLGLNAGV